MNQSILVVEDEPAVAEAIVGILEDEGYRCTIAHAGAEALAIFRKQHFDVVVSDFMMPGMTGFELMKHVRDIVPGIPFLLISGYINREDALEAGADDFLDKPGRVSEVNDSLKRILAARQGQG